MKLSKTYKIDKDFISSPNLCGILTEEDRSAIGSMVLDGYNKDEQSRTQWLKRVNAAMELALQIQKEKSFPWPNCSNIVFPLVTIAALQFSARSYSNIIQGTDVVRYRVASEDPQGELRLAADRISSHMSWQVLEEDAQWEEQHDRLLINLSIVGTSFIKTFYSPSKGHNVSELVLAQDFVLDYYAKSVETCARKTQKIQLYRNEIHERIQRGVFSDLEEEGWFCGAANPTNDPKSDNRQGKTPPASDNDTPFNFLEQHRLIDMDGDGYAEPYIATIEANSGCLCRLVARWEREEDIERTATGEIISIRAMEYFTKFGFIPAPDGGIYDVGFGVLLGPLNESVNSGINQLLDAGTMANSTGGFLGRGAKIRGGVYTMAPWEWKRIDSTGDDIRKSMVPLPVRDPSAVLFNLLNLLINYTDRVSGATDIMVGENPGQNTPAETTRNMIEQGMQLYSTIFKRVWRSLKEEFKKLHKLNSIYLPDRQRFGAQGAFIRREDYKSNPNQVVPSADPSITSKSMRFTLALKVREAAMTSPGGYDLEEVEKLYLKALGVDEISRLYPGLKAKPPGQDVKLQLKQMDLQLAQAKLQFEKQKFAMELIEEQRMNQAEIVKLQAEVQSLQSQAQTAQSSTQLKALDVLVKSYKTRNDVVMSRIEALLTAQGMTNEQANSGEGGGVSGLAGESGDAGIPAIPSGMAGGSDATMG